MANKSNFTDYKLTTTGYASFDATSLKNYIITRLNENKVFTDQNFEGSNLSSVIDIIAYSYHVLLFYLNQYLQILQGHQYLKNLTDQFP